MNDINEIITDLTQRAKKKRGKWAYSTCGKWKAIAKSKKSYIFPIWQILLCVIGVVLSGKPAAVVFSIVGTMYGISLYNIYKQSDLLIKQV